MLVHAWLVRAFAACGAFLILLGQASGGVDAPPASPSATTAEIEQRVAGLIEQLGAERYATREKAAAELSQLGLEAFDALHAAQLHADIEIAERARYLLNSMQVVWSRPGDSAEVKRLLKDYSQQADNDRRSRIERLGRLEGGEGLAALCRLVRFEMSTILAKEAALVVMTRPQFAAADQRDALREAIASQIGASQREAAAWLRAWEQTLADPARAADGWRERIAAEHRLLTDFGDERTSHRIVRDLYRWQAELLQQLDRQDDAIEAVRQIIALSDGSRPQLLEIIDWLIQREAWSVVDEVAEKHPDRFREDPYLLYRLAEAQVARGDREAGERTAEQAFALAPKNPNEHLLVAYQLQERGRFDWSEREYRGIIGSVELASANGVDARSMLAEMLHDQGRDDAAAAVLDDLVKAIESSEATRDAVDTASRRRSSGEILSRSYYFAALDLMAQDKLDEARAAMEKGAEANEEDADLLIAMYRLPLADEAWRRNTRELIRKSADSFKEMVDQMQRIIDDSDNEQHLNNAKTLQAMYCNQYAWLVGNTEGDYEEAIRLSRRSLEIRPESAGYMDTLAHCYFTAGDFDSAIKWQTKAVKLEPHSGQIARALAKFQRAAAEKK